MVEKICLHLAETSQSKLLFSKIAKAADLQAQSARERAFGSATFDTRALIYKNKVETWEIRGSNDYYYVHYVYIKYLWRAFEVHAGHRQSSDVHGDAPVQVERANDEEEAAADDRPGREERNNT